MFPLLQLGSYALPLPGVILLAAMWIGLSLAEKEARRQNRPPEPLYGLVMFFLIGGALGARLGYAVRYLDVYLADPISFVSLDANTLDLTTGIILGILSATFYGHHIKLHLRATLDILTPGFAFLSIGLGIAHLSSGNAFGSQTTMPWAIYLWDASRHPTQIYETVLAVIIFLAIWVNRKDNPFSGFLFLAWVGLTAVSRLFIEAFRGDSILVGGNVRQAQILSLIVLLFAMWLMYQWATPPISQKEPVWGSN